MQTLHILFAGVDGQFLAPSAREHFRKNTPGVLLFIRDVQNSSVPLMRFLHVQRHRGVARFAFVY